MVERSVCCDGDASFAEVDSSSRFVFFDHTFFTYITIRSLIMTKGRDARAEFANECVSFRLRAILPGEQSCQAFMHLPYCSILD